MKLNLLLTPMFLFLVGCATSAPTPISTSTSTYTPIEFVRTDHGPKKQAVVRYIPLTDPNSKIDYKAELHTQAAKFCDGEYKINDEYQAMSDTLASAGLVSAESDKYFLKESHNRLATYDYTEFVCKEKGSYAR